MVQALFLQFQEQAFPKGFYIYLYFLAVANKCKHTDWYPWGSAAVCFHPVELYKDWRG